MSIAIHQCKLRLTTRSPYNIFQLCGMTLCLLNIYTPNITCNCSDALTAHTLSTLISFYFTGRKFYADTKYSLFSKMYESICSIQLFLCITSTVVQINAEVTNEKQVKILPVVVCIHKF
jgi:hypothetical protein